MSQKPRTFIFNDQELPDPDPSKTPNEVKEIYAATYPSLTTANAVFSKKDGKDVYEFKTSPGTKG